ncbi:MAG: hypothetical protein NVV59_04160 [Chitinophagaceae bacterium]|nr:hypothetical protein [Chitinophagaceae bacterium]
MKNHILLAFGLLGCGLIHAQQTRYYSDPQTKFKEAKAYFQNGQYGLAYPLLRELRQSVRETDVVNQPITVQEINYYSLACALMQDEARAEQEAIDYIDLEKNTARVQMMNYHLGEFYFRHSDFKKAVEHYELSNIANLSNTDIATMKFHQGYSYFTLQRFAQAKPLFNAIRSNREDPQLSRGKLLLRILSFPR